MPRYSWEPSSEGAGAGLAAPLLAPPSTQQQRVLSDGERFGLRTAQELARSKIKDCPSDEAEWPQYEILEARGCCSFFAKLHRYIWFLWFDPLMKLGAETHLEFSHICEARLFNTLDPAVS